MTVRELIAELSNHDPDMIVVVNSGKNEYANAKPARTVEAIDAYECEGHYFEDFYPGIAFQEYPKSKVVNIFS